MDASLETLVIAGYVFACSLSIPRPPPAGTVTDPAVRDCIAHPFIELVRKFRGRLWRVLRRDASE
jgi:hypothetical protein